MLEIVASADGAVATGVVYEPANGAATTIDADLVVDASGRGSFTLALLEATGRKLPAETRIELDVGYATATFAIPNDEARDWKGVMHLPQAPQKSAGALLFPVEGRRWTVSVGGRGDEKPPWATTPAF